MDLWRMIGSVALGTVVGLAARFFFERFEKFDPKGLSAVFGCIFGGAAIGYLSSWLKDPVAAAVYPVGILVGFVVNPLIFKKTDSKPPVPQPAASPPIDPPLGPPISQPNTSVPIATFTLLEVKKTLRFVDRDDHEAQLQRLMTMRANARATGFWICTISADGEIPIDSIVVDSSSYGAKPRIEETAGQIDIYAVFEAETQPNDIIELRLEYKVFDAFKNKNEYIGHSIQHETERISIEVIFHEEHPCLSGSLLKKFAGDVVKMKDSQVGRSQTGLRLTTEISEMLKIGQEYRLSWRW